MINVLNIGKTTSITFFLSMLIFMTSSCSQKNNNADTKNEIRQTEKDFQQLLNSEGAALAFYTFAADSAVIKRENDTLIIGKEAIKKYYLNHFYKNATAVWEPDLIDVSDDGTMAYTFGKYEWSFTDSTGKKTNYRGIFHTVWKKMSDGSWKYVWD